MNREQSVEPNIADLGNGWIKEYGLGVIKKYKDKEKVKPIEKKESSKETER